MKVNLHRFFQGKSHQIPRPVTAGHGHQSHLSPIKIPLPLHLFKGTVAGDVFGLFSPTSCLDRKYIEVFLIIPVINQGRVSFYSCDAWGECSKWAYAPSPTMYVRTMHFFLQTRPNKILMRSSMATRSSRNFFKDRLFSYTGFCQSCIFFPRLLNSFSDVGECAEWR